MSRRSWAEAVGIPCGCLVWIGVVFVAQAIFAGFVLGEDSAVGDGFECRLKNGYLFLAMDTLESARISAPDRNLSFECVVRLQELGTKLLMERKEDCSGPDAVPTFVLVDTQSGALGTYSTEAKLAQAIGSSIQLQPVADVYEERRSLLFRLLVLVVTVLPPIWFAKRILGRKQLPAA